MPRDGGLPGAEPGLNAPASGGVAIVGDDNNNLAAVPARSLYIGVTGDVKVALADQGDIVTFKNVPVGILPVRIRRLYATGTTATQVLALY